MSVLFVSQQTNGFDTLQFIHPLFLSEELEMDEDYLLLPTR